MQIVLQKYKTRDTLNPSTVTNQEYFSPLEEMWGSHEQLQF